MKVDFNKQNVRTFEIFYESTGLTEANFLHPLAKLCVQDAGRTPKKITALVISNSKGLSEILRDIRTSTYQICRIVEKLIRLNTFNKYMCN